MSNRDSSSFRRVSVESLTRGFLEAGFASPAEVVDGAEEWQLLFVVQDESGGEARWSVDIVERSVRVDIRVGERLIATTFHESLASVEFTGAVVRSVCSSEHWDSRIDLALVPIVGLEVATMKVRG
jgi:hypothetical protein